MPLVSFLAFRKLWINKTMHLVRKQAGLPWEGARCSRQRLAWQLQLVQQLRLTWGGGRCSRHDLLGQLQLWDDEPVHLVRCTKCSRQHSLGEALKLLGELQRLVVQQAIKTWGGTQVTWGGATSALGRTYLGRCSVKGGVAGSSGRRAGRLRVQPGEESGRSWWGRRRPGS